MAHKKDPRPLVRGTAKHRRTEGDYMGVLLDAVTLDDWCAVVAATVELAKGGDAAARAWLGQYLVGKPEAKAPTPLTVVVQQLSGDDPLVERLAQPHLNRVRFPMLQQDEDWEAAVRSLVAAELARKLPETETATTPTTGDPGQPVD
jgi:hypothetical protein